MANIIDYVKWRGDLELELSAFNEIDSLILNRFSYFPLDNIVKENEITTIEELGKRFKNIEKEKLNILWEEDAILFPEIAQSKRFSKMEVSDYVNIVDKEIEKQFSAVSILLPDNTIYISFRGTDNTLVGWKEDFNMGFKSHLESQISAKEYLNTIAEKYPQKNIRIGGHSKGGNLAIYAGVFAKDSVKKRILNIYNNDGPGFNEDIVNTEEYKNVINKVTTYIPQSSIFGLMLEHKEKYVIVQSIEKGTMQHDVYSWQVLGTNFVILKEVTNGSKFIDKTITTWLKNLDLKSREQMVNIIFEVINSTNVNRVSELKISVMKNAGMILSSYSQIDDENKKMLTQTIKALFRIAKDTAINNYSNMKNNIEQRRDINE